MRPVEGPVVWPVDQAGEELEEEGAACVVYGFVACPVEVGAFGPIWESVRVMVATGGLVLATKAGVCKVVLYVCEKEVAQLDGEIVLGCWRYTEYGWMLEDVPDGLGQDLGDTVQ